MATCLKGPHADLENWGSELWCNVPRTEHSRKNITDIKFTNLFFWGIILILESVSLEGTSGDHLVYSFCSDQGQLEKVAQQCVQLDF